MKFFALKIHEPRQLALITTGLVAATIILIEFITGRVISLALISVVLVGLYMGTYHYLKSQQGAMRRQIIFEVRLMLMDIIRNDLATVSMNIGFARDLSDSRHDRINAAIKHITDTLDTLDEATLLTWRDKYRHTLEVSQLKQKV